MLSSLVLASAGIGMLVIGLTYLFRLDIIIASLAIKADSTAIRHVLRANYGGTFPAFAILFILGAFIPALTFSALIALLCFMAGFAIGRIVSFKLDGRAALFMYVLTLVEIVYSVLALYLLVTL